MQRTATAGFYAGFVGQGIEYTQIISNADYQLSMIITSAKGVNSINNPLSYLLFIKDFSLTQTIDAAKAGLQDVWNGTYDSAIGRKIGAGTFNYLLMTIGGAQLKGKGTACEAVESDSGSVPNSLLQGDPNTRVYLGIIDGEPDYVGIAYDVERRQSQHGDRFDYLREITTEPLTRRQARAIEQAMIKNHPEYSNKINSISTKRDWYNDAVTWGKAWLREHGLLE